MSVLPGLAGMDELDRSSQDPSPNMHTDFAALLRVEMSRQLAVLRTDVRQDVHAELEALRSELAQQRLWAKSDSEEARSSKKPFPHRPIQCKPDVDPEQECRRPKGGHVVFNAPRAASDDGVEETVAGGGDPKRASVVMLGETLQVEKSETGVETRLETARRRASMSSQKEALEASKNIARPNPVIWNGRGFPVLHPDSRFGTAWRPFMLSAILVAVVMAPFDVAYYWWEAPKAYKVFGVLLDTVFLLDMVVHFNTAVYHHGHLHTDHPTIACHYAKTYLVPDLISNVPLDWFVGGDGKSRKFAKLVKVPKILRFLKLIAAMQDEMEYFGVTTSVALLALLAHYSSCFWALSLARDCDDLNVCPSVGAAYLQAFRISVASFISTEAGYYFVPSETFTPHLASSRAVGESLYAYEDAVLSLVNILGLLLVGFLFANVASTLKVRSEASRMQNAMVDIRKEEMSIAQTPKYLEKKVLATYKHLRKFGGFNDGILRDQTLSLDLRREIAFCMYGQALRRIPIFEKIPNRFLKCLAQTVEVHLYTPGDLIMLFGEVGKELYIMLQGKARPLGEDGEYLGETVFAEGSFFGELCFLSPGTRRSASVLCLEFCRAMVLTLEAFHEFALTDNLISGVQQAFDNIPDRLLTRSKWSGGRA